MTTKLPWIRRTNRTQSERVELAEYLAKFEPKTELGAKLLALSKQGLEDGEPLLDLDGVLRELGRRRYEE